MRNSILSILVGISAPKKKYLAPPSSDILPSPVPPPLRFQQNPTPPATCSDASALTPSRKYPKTSTKQITVMVYNDRVVKLLASRQLFVNQGKLRGSNRVLAKAIFEASDCVQIAKQCFGSLNNVLHQNPTIRTEPITNENLEILFHFPFRNGKRE